MMIGTFVFTVERRDIGQRNYPKKQQLYEADWTEAGMEVREEPATLNRKQDREEHMTHLEGECTTPTQTLVIDVKDFRFFFRKER